MQSAVLPRTCIITDLTTSHAERYILENNLFDLGAMRWCTCPDLTQQWHNNLEAEFCKFFNEVATACGRAMNANPPLRAWTANYSTTVLTGHEARRKPDLALIDFHTPADWRCVRSVGEMKSKRYTSTGFSEIWNQNSGMDSLIVIAEVLYLHWTLRSQSRLPSFLLLKTIETLFSLLDS
jgi:hypothetical protein